MSKTPLFIAIEARKHDATLLLIILGADVNIICEDWTPLGMAVKMNDYDICKMLLEGDANVNQRIAYAKFTALHLAAYNKYMHICDLL